MIYIIKNMIYSNPNTIIIFGSYMGIFYFNKTT